MDEEYAMKKARMDLIVAKMAWKQQFVDEETVIRHQNYVDSLQMEKEMRQAEERDALEKARLKRREEFRLREEERIRKMKNSWFFAYQKLLGRKEEDILKQMEAEDNSDYRPLLPHVPLKWQY